MTESGRQAFVEMGIAAERIRVVGSCEYDALVRRVEPRLTADQERELRARLGLLPGRPVILFSHQHVLDPPEMRPVMQKIAAATRRCGAALLVKFHPRSTDDPEEWRQWAQGEGFGEEDVVFVRNECTAIEAVRLCTVCVTFFSTTALEALVWRKPLVLIQCVNTWYVLEYGSQYGAALEAKKLEDLEPAVISAATDPEVQERLRRGAEAALQKELFGLDGQSSRRMADSVIDLIERRRGKG
jgi:hypothetical protein